MNDPNWRTVMGTTGQTETSTARTKYTQVRNLNRASADPKVQAKAAEVKTAYILLDPYRLANDPAQSTFQQMVSAIIYVGEGDMARPSDHPSDALRSDRELQELRVRILVSFLQVPLHHELS